MSFGEDGASFTESIPSSDPPPTVRYFNGLNVCILNEQATSREAKVSSLIPKKEGRNEEGLECIPETE